MAKGRPGFYLEAWKFGVYLIIPIGASWYYSDPQRQKQAADYWRYVQYPAHPNVGLKDQVQELARQQKQRQAYKEQMELLQRQAQKTLDSQSRALNNNRSEEADEHVPTEAATKPAWSRWFHR